ncbi:unnamed protein product [Danaus chrysippus]|uniref:(African queen) hypothetical protein n=1 Tax=Danaus chrysippus TaxID=151541 RepID=A0A8J2QJ94_9NEOP|nr:unnamed protein product [Danaus chrysippus]
MARYGGGAEEPAAVRVRLSPSYLSRPPPGPDAHDPSAPHRLNSYRDRAMSPYTRALPVVWCMRDNQLVPHQVSGVKLQGAVTGAHIAAVSDFLRMVAGTPIILQPPAVHNNIDNEISKDNTIRRRKMSMQLEVPCVFLSESALQKAKCRHNSLDEQEPLQRITKIIEFENDKLLSPVSVDEDNEVPQKITRIIEFNEENTFSSLTNSIDDLTRECSQKIPRILEPSKENVFPSMAKIIEMENEKSNERRISLTSEREISCGTTENCTENEIIRSKPLQRSRFSVDSSCSENSYANIDTIKSLQDVRKEDTLEFSTNTESITTSKPTIRSRFRRKKTSVCSIGSSDCDDEIDVIFKSKPKSSQWVSLDWIPPPIEEPVIAQVCDKNDFISKWIAEQNSQDSGIIPDERRKSLPPKSNEVYIQNMRRFSDGLQICKEDAASDSPATVKWKWHDIVKRHLQLLKNDKGFRRQRGSWIRTARRLSGTNDNKFSEQLPLDTYMKLNTMPHIRKILRSGLLIRRRSWSACYESLSEHALPQGRSIRMQRARVQGYVCAVGRCTGSNLPPACSTIGSRHRK